MNPVLRTLLPALFILSACGVDIDFWDDREFDVVMPANADPTLSERLEVDLHEHSDFADKAKEIVDVDVTEIWLEVLSVGEANKATKVSGRLEVSLPGDGAQKTLIADYKDLAIGVGGKVKLEWDAAGYEKIKSLALDSPHQFSVYVNGSLDAVPADFKVKARLHIVANVGF